MSTAVFEVTGLHCSSCAGKVSSAVNTVDGVTGVELDLATGRLSVTSGAPIDDSAIVAVVTEAGYQVAPA
ncbi:heavy-metal-associated domain-containing protein [Occultella glacieicola]|uniref:Heavy-metal-associated domain-containing protein n=1 Tax=Occultella glacieicola TaxID=2518684 RepID=A0ABY2E207_9MICO|nr:heavy metal-associated domain-containing protein [Occultella glacieicola]TDE88556.1 heavy-metal-associated domain-containing protein [Occultella glacieicola]